MSEKVLKQRVLDKLAKEKGLGDFEEAKEHLYSACSKLYEIHEDLERVAELTLEEVEKEIDKYAKIVKAFIDHPPEDEEEAIEEKSMNWSIYNALLDLKKRLNKGEKPLNDA